MQGDKTEIKVFKMSVLLFLIVGLIFLVFISVDYSLIIGWIVGSISILIGYIMGIFLMNIFFNKNKTKFMGFLIGLIKFYVNLFFQSLILILIILINNWVNGYNFMEGNLNDMLYPINIFTYIGGISLIFVSTLIVQITCKNIRKDGDDGKTINTQN